MLRTRFVVQTPRRASESAAVEPLETRTLCAAVRAFDGTGNNLLHPDWGAAGTALLRLAAAQYADGVSSPAGASRPSARAVSNALAAHPEDSEILSSTHLSAFAYLWGQFIDHDLDLTTPGSPSEPFNVAVPAGTCCSTRWGRGRR